LGRKKRIVHNKKTTEQYKLDLEEVNGKRGTNVRLKEGVEYVGNRTKITHICTCGKEWNVAPNNVLNNNSTKCGLCYTFKQWCIDNERQDVLDRWDYELNNCEPNKITYGDNKKYYFKCSRGLHKSELKKISDFTIKHCEGTIKCKQCNSFSQWGIG